MAFKYFVTPFIIRINKLSSSTFLKVNSKYTENLTFYKIVIHYLFKMKMNRKLCN